MPLRGSSESGDQDRSHLHQSNSAEYRCPLCGKRISDPQMRCSGAGGKWHTPGVLPVKVGG